MDFVTIDFETAIISQESACAVGLVRFVNGEAVDTYYSLIRPPKLYIRPDFTDIHGLTVDDVRDAPKFDELWDSGIKTFIGDFPLAAHNAKFDMGVLRAALQWYELDVPAFPYFCTCHLSRRVWPGFKSHALPSLADHFGIKYNAHNALDDAMTCGKLVLNASQKYGSGSLKELLSRAGMKISILSNEYL